MCAHATAVVTNCIITGNGGGGVGWVPAENVIGEGAPSPAGSVENVRRHHPFLVSAAVIVIWRTCQL